MDKNEFFNKTTQHLIKQAKRAANDNGLCMYRTSEGLACAVGCHIPDDKYHTGLEETPVVPWDSDNPEQVKHAALVQEAAGISDDLLPLANALQRVHDKVSPKHWPVALFTVAKIFDITDNIRFYSPEGATWSEAHEFWLSLGKD